jgi:hypothetical protein
MYVCMYAATLSLLVSEVLCDGKSSQSDTSSRVTHHRNYIHTYSGRATLTQWLTNLAPGGSFICPYTKAALDPGMGFPVALSTLITPTYIHTYIHEIGHAYIHTYIQR